MPGEDPEFPATPVGRQAEWYVAHMKAHGADVTENEVAEHPCVSEAAVVGAPDPLMGEVPVAFVVLHPGSSATEEEIQRFCRQRMAAYRVPARVTFVTALPRNEAGKLLRAQLAAPRPAQP